jgi:hypothetical protein
LTGISARAAGAVQSFAYTYDLLGKLLTRNDANALLAKSFTYDALNRSPGDREPHAHAAAAT